MNSTIIDVAKKAGVSVATVSRVVNGNYPVKQETKKKVRQAIDALQYVPNIQARELNMQKSTTIGIIVPSLHNMFFAEVINGIEEQISGKMYSLLLCCAKNDPKLEARCVNELISRNVSGIIVISPNTENLETDFYDRIAKSRAMVFINSYVKRPGISYVSNDEYQGTILALEHLYHYGHRRILFIRGLHSDSYQIKESAYKDFMQARSLFHPEDILNIGEGNSTETVDNTMFFLMDRMLANKASAIFACNDLMGVGAVNACKRMKKRIPRDISVVGFDNISLSHFIEPKLTTMDQNMFQLGMQACGLLIKKINGQSVDDIVLQNYLVERETTGPFIS